MTRGAFARATAVALALMLACGLPARTWARVAKHARSARASAAASAVATGGPSARARALADQKRYAEALEVIHEALRVHPDDTDLLWLEAGVTGWSGHHAQAVHLYERLRLRHPELPRDLARDLASERLEAGDAKGALDDLDRLLRADPSDHESRVLRARALAELGRHAESLAAYDTLIAGAPDDLDLAIARARALGWMGKNARASAAYAAVLARAPDNEDAQLGLAQNQNWEGYHRRAAVMLEGMLARGDRDPEVTKTLAFAYYWDGRPEASRLALDGYLAERPDDREALELSRRLARENAASLSISVGRSDDSDALRIRTTAMEYRRPLARATALALRWRRDNVEDPGGTRDPLQIGVGIEKRWSSIWAARLDLAVLHARPHADATGLGELDVTFRPDDRWRWDASFDRELVMTRLSLARDVTVSAIAAGVDWQALDRLRLELAQRFRAFSDDNHAMLTSARARVAVVDRAGLRGSATLGAEWLHTDRDLDDGYYDPRHYVEWGPGIDLDWTPRERWELGFVGQIGRQHQRGLNAESFHTFNASAELPLGRRLGLGLEGGRSNSNLSSASGFRQNHWSASLTTHF